MPAVPAAPTALPENSQDPPGPRGILESVWESAPRTLFLLHDCGPREMGHLVCSCSHYRWWRRWRVVDGFARASRGGVVTRGGGRGGRAGGRGHEVGNTFLKREAPAHGKRLPRGVHPGVCVGSAAVTEIGPAHSWLPDSGPRLETSKRSPPQVMSATAQNVPRIFLFFNCPSRPIGRAEWAC